MKILTLAAVVVAALVVAALVVAAPARAQKLAWSDEFNGKTLNHREWAVTPGYHICASLAISTPSDVKVNGKGRLVITARKTKSGYTSGELERKASSPCGTLKASIKIPAGKGLWPAFWAQGVDYPTVGWPTCGELDAMENLGNNTHVVYGSVHAPGYDRTTAVRSKSNLAAGFHTYSVKWTPYVVQIALDGRVYVKYMPNMSSIFGQPFYVILDLAVGGSWPGNPSSATRFPASMVVNWVRAYD